MSDTQAGTIDGISYASTQYVYDPNGQGFVTEILYDNASGSQVAQRDIFSVNVIYLDGKTVNEDGTFSIKLTNPGANNGYAKPYTLETFSSSGIWVREDDYAPIFTDASSPGNGISGWSHTGFTLVNATGTGSSGLIGGTYYDMVETKYDGNAKPIETDYLNNLNGTSTLVAKQITSQPDPILVLPPTATATAGTAQPLGGFSLTDSWAASHAGSLALDIMIDSGSLSGTDSAGKSFSASAGAPAHLTGTLAQVQTDLYSLFFNGPAGTAHFTVQIYDQAGVSASATETVTVSPASSGTGTSPPSPTPAPVLSGPATLSIPADTQIHGLNTSFSDSWAVNHGGSLALNVTTTLGTLTDVVAGHSMTATSLHLTGTYSQIEADVSGLALAASQAGSGTVRIEVYDQAGVEAVHVIGVTAQASAST